jgi:hypothetical protein
MLCCGYPAAGIFRLMPALLISNTHEYPAAMLYYSVNFYQWYNGIVFFTILITVKAFIKTKSKNNVRKSS